MKEQGQTDPYNNLVASNFFFCFGKYNGHPIEEVEAKDPGYLVWLYENNRCPFRLKMLLSCKIDKLRKKATPMGDL